MKTKFYVLALSFVLFTLACEKKDNVDDAADENTQQTTPVVDDNNGNDSIIFGYDSINNTLTDGRDSNVYKTVTIGDQVWMAENLAYLPSVNQVADGSADSADSYYYVYGYDGTDVTDAKATENYDTYGVLYNWSAAMAGSASSSANPSGVQGVCPTGWHLPSDAEWIELTDYLGPDAGSKLAGNAILWTDGNLNQNANFGETAFTALPGGYRRSNGSFGSIGYGGYWWSATENYAANAWYRYVFYDHSKVYSWHWGKESGLSVRCMKD